MRWLHLLYGLFCLAVAVRGFCVLNRMTRHTSMMRRVVWLLLTWGGMIGVIELWADAPPAASITLMGVGAGALLVVGARWPLRDRSRHGPPAPH